MHRLVNRGGQLVPPDDIETQLEEAESRPSRVHDEPLPLPPKTPSLATQRARLWTPPVIAALITAATSFAIEWITQPEPVTKGDIEAAIQPLKAAISDVRSDLKAHAGEHKTDERLDENRRRVVDDALARHQQQIETLRDRYR